jgi:3-hydroxybutyryl-CoA dehydrogenase
MGKGISLDLALRGLHVTVTDSSHQALADAPQWILDTLEELERLGHPLAINLSQVAARIALTQGLDEVAGADLVIEAITEDLEAKKQLLATVESLLSADALLATNTSSLSISDLEQGLEQPGRFVGMHFFNPPAMLPLVEVFGGDNTSAVNVRRVLEFLRVIGKEPVHLRQPVPGLVANRLQFALLWEAIRICEMNIAAPADIDRVVRHGFGRRLAVLGPFANADLGGLDTYRRIFDYLSPSMAWPGPPRTLLELVAGGHLGASAGRGFLEWTSDQARQSTEQRNRTLVWLLTQDLKGERRDEQI